MTTARAALIGGLVAMLALPAIAAAKVDFGGLAICSKLTALPQGQRLTACNKRAPLRGECTFGLSSNGVPIEYRLIDGMVASKQVRLQSGAKFAAPYGLQAGDSIKTAAAKVRTKTGKASRHWGDHEDATSSYLQSEDVSCGAAASYKVFVWFKNGRATSVLVSTLPMI